MHWSRIYKKTHLVIKLLLLKKIRYQMTTLVGTPVQSDAIKTTVLL